MIRARLRLSVPDVVASRSLVGAVEPDNLKMEGLHTVGRSSRHSATFTLTFEGRVETFIFTLDDLLRCLQAAQETLESLLKNWSSASVKGN